MSNWSIYFLLSSWSIYFPFISSCVSKRASRPLINIKESRGDLRRTTTFSCNPQSHSHGSGPEGLGSLSKHDVDGSANIILKCNFVFLQSFLNYSRSLCLKNKKTKLNICHYMLTLSTQLQNRSFHVVETMRMSLKCQKMKNARAKRAKMLFFIVNYANLRGFCCPQRRGCLSSLYYTPATNHKSNPPHSLSTQK